ncbi:MAG: RseC/MucC family positive regulator of sigma(E) [Bacteroidia bacterium]|nr:RseC/MucC family positive regulator of sigma(E) [Bacteroidia bacterium]
MTNTIKQSGIVESINGSHIQVRIIQTSACASCSIKGHCTASECKDQIIDINDWSSSTYSVGEQVWIIGETSMGVFAVLLAFIIPFILLISFLFLFMSLLGSELYAALLALCSLIPYYITLHLNKTRLKQKLSFTIKPTK